MRVGLDLVRIVWQYIESLDLRELDQSIKATRDNVGGDAIDPRILFALLLFVTIEGLSSARRIDELTRRDIAYMWICGGVSVNYHRLSDFRAQHGELLERVMTGSIAVLIHQGLIDRGVPQRRLSQSRFVSVSRAWTSQSQAQTLCHVLAYNFMRMRNLVCRLREQSYLEVVMGKSESPGNESRPNDSRLKRTSSHPLTAPR